MTITFQSESWDSYYNDPDRSSLWLEHYTEFEPVHENKMAMSPDVGFFSTAYRLGQLEIVVARKDGEMIGYCLVIVRPHVHYSQSLCAFEDSYFLTKSERKGLAGYKLIARMLTVLRKRGCVRGYFMTKEFISVAELFERLGMTKMDSVYTIWLGTV